MKNRPRLSARSRMQTPHGIVLDVPTKCELGTLNEHCDEQAVMQFGPVRICRRHAQLVADIEADAPSLEDYRPKVA